jgi:NADH-quinone oxidoreductase subunit B
VDAGGGWSLWVFDAGLACCAVECAAALRRLPAPSGGAAGGNVLLVAGTVTDKLAPLVLRAYQDLPEPRHVISFGACSNTGGPYWDSYCVTKGVDQFVPVDVYVPGCPQRPEAFMQGLLLLQDAIGKERRPLSWVVGDQGVYRAPMPAQRDLKLEERRAQTVLRTPDSV